MKTKRSEGKKAGAYSCTECDKSYSSSGWLEKHIKTKHSTSHTASACMSTLLCASGFICILRWWINGWLNWMSSNLAYEFHPWSIMSRPIFLHQFEIVKDDKREKHLCAEKLTGVTCIPQGNLC